MEAWGLFVLLAVGGAVYVAILIAMTAWMLTHPPRRTYAWAVSRGRPGDPGELEHPRGFESWTFEFRGLALPVWDIPGERTYGPVIVLTTGWGDSRIGSLLRVPALLPHASRLILWEMPGHGEAPGHCTLGTREPQALQLLIDRVADDRKVILYGWSLGAGASIVAAVGDGRVAAVIAEAPYRLPPTPARRVLLNVRMPHVLNLRPALWALGTIFGVGPRFRAFDRAAHAARLTCPLLVLHGTDDGVCPVQDGREIAAAARGTFVAIDGGGHNNLWVEDEFTQQMTRAIHAFLDDLAGAVQ